MLENLHLQKNDSYGNPRYAIHFLNVLSRAELDSDQSISSKYLTALNKCRQFGGKKYHNKSFGGGIIFTTYDPEGLAKKLETLI